MKNKIGIFALFGFFLSFLTFRIVDDAGAGGGAVDDDIGDFEIEDDEPDNDEPKNSDDDSKSDGKDDELTKEIEELKAFKDEIEAEKATNEALTELSSKYDNFDAEKVYEHLIEMEKKEKGSSEPYNNPLGWENIHLQHFNKKAPQGETSYFDRGREEHQEPFDFKKGMEKALGGDKNSIAELLENSKG